MTTFFSVTNFCATTDHAKRAEAPHLYFVPKCTTAHRKVLTVDKLSANGEGKAR
jgi:hypothetical protein